MKLIIINSMFTQRCFIRKNTYELVEKLKVLGYNQGFSARGNFGDSLLTTLNSMGGNIYGFLSNPSDKIEDPIIDDIDGVNCGTNEELFLAIAALRDDSDIHQWFIHQDCSFLKCECDSKIDMWGDYEYPEIYPRKATVKELIKYFAI
jgi:hypothetical protein